MNKSLTSRLIVTLLISALIYMVAIAGALIEFGIKKAKDNALIQQEKLVTTVRASASIAAYVENEEIAEEVGSSLLLHPEILAVKITSNESFNYVKQRDIGLGDIDWEQSGYQYILLSPVNNLSTGSISIILNEELLNQNAIDVVEAQIKLLVFQTIILLIVMLIAIKKVVGTPLKRVAAQLAIIRPGEETKLTLDEQHQNDEIGLVTSSVNQFVESATSAIHTERALREKISLMEKHYRNVLEKAQIGFFVLNEKTELLKGNDVLFESLERHLLLSKEDILGQCLFDSFLKDSTLGNKLAKKAKLTQEPISQEFVIEPILGEPVWIQLLISAYQDSTTLEWYYEGVIYNVTDRVIKEQQALNLAQLDTLTGLKNRLGCADFLLKSKPGSEDKVLAVMVLDLDGFKTVNDTFGHAAGDEVLCIIAQRLKNQVRQNKDLVSRLGGDEFAVLISCDQKSTNLVEYIAQKLIDTVSKPIVLKQGAMVNVGVSIGIAFDVTGEFDVCLSLADEAMYQVKKDGKNGYRLYRAS